MGIRKLQERYGEASEGDCIRGENEDYREHQHLRDKERAHEGNLRTGVGGLRCRNRSGREIG